MAFLYNVYGYQTVKPLVGAARSCSAIAASLLALLVPKCPLCLLPLLALIGVSLPAGRPIPYLHLIPPLSLVVFAALSRGRSSRVLALCAAPLIGLGRALNVAPAYWIAIALVITAVVLHLRGTLAQCRSCGVAARRRLAKP